jgi:hypothetical protein
MSDPRTEQACIGWTVRLDDGRASGSSSAMRTGTMTRVARASAARRDGRGRGDDAASDLLGRCVADPPAVAPKWVQARAGIPPVQGFHRDGAPCRDARCALIHW